MTLRQLHGRPVTEDVSDLSDWLRTLDDCPAITVTQPLSCADHGDEPATWFYVEADPAAGVARVRCLGCGRARHLLDSEKNWTYPPTWQCGNCRHSIAEVVTGGHESGGGVDWVAVAVRCVECGSVSGVTDAVVPAEAPIGQVFGRTAAIR